MAAYGSSASASGTGSAVVTKPTGLAAGDLMVAFVGDNASTNTPSTPSGWTLITSAVSAFDEDLYCFAKIASAGDAAASNFTFAHGNGAAVVRADMYRITGTFASTGNIYKYAAASATEASADVFRCSTGITPDVASSLLIMAFLGQAASTGFNTTANALQTSSPTWTEQHDNSYGTEYRLASATATRTEVTDTGYFQVTYTTVDVTRAVGMLLAIADTQNGTATPSAVAMTATVGTPVGSGGATVTATVVGITPAVGTATATGGTDDALWKNVDKPSAGAITNTDKP
jgi:hypothetical protein